MSKYMWPFIFMMTLSLQNHVAVSASYNSSNQNLSANIQKLALYQFKLSFKINSSASELCEGLSSGPSHPKTMNWSMSSDCCTWDGVTCDHITGNVIGLDLSCSHLVGSIPPNSTIFNLSFLQIIVFDSNNLFGALPVEIFHLPNLEALSLQFNSHLIVSLPKNKWGSSSSLQVLALTLTTLSGGIPDSIGFLQSLTFLSLSQCNISGSIPRSFSNLTQLTYLNLASNHFSGPIPYFLGNLQNLKILYLDFNNFIGLIPRSIGNLTQLSLLSLNSNSLTDQIPDSLAGLQNLTFLSLSHNKLTGQFPSWVANFSELTFLDLSENSLTGPLPSNLTLPNLTFLDLSDNSLNGTIPSVFFKFPSLTNLYLDYNKFTGHVHEFDSSKPLLQGFSCSNNLLDGPIPHSFSELVNLTSLDFSSNKFSGVDIGIFSPLKHLESLDLSHNSLSVRSTSTPMLPPRIQSLLLASCKIKEFPHFVRTAKSLAYLDLSNNQINGEIPQWIGSMGMHSMNYLNISHNSLTGGLENLPWNKLKYLDLQSNILQGSLPASICNSSSLIILNLSHNNLSGLLPSCTRSLKYSLSVFDLRMNSMGGSLPSTLINFRKLRSLNLHGNKLEGTIPSSFSEFDYLEVFDLGNNQINDTFPQCLETLQNLQVLILKSNKFFGIITKVSKIEHPFPSLRIIDLSDNEFLGPLPAKYIQNFKGMMNPDVNKLGRSYMGNSGYSDTVIMVIKGVEIEFTKILTIFTTMDLSRNKFEGEIPEYIGNLESLRYLNLSHNNLTGHIPSLIGKLSMLESLDLSFNRLVGVIPQQLTSIYSLSRLDLSQNDLVGHIPEGAQFNTFENDSYAGNFGLCGRPLSKKCTSKKQQEKIGNDEDEDEDDDLFFSGFTWEAVAIGYGCGVLVGFVVGYVMFLAGKPKWYTRIFARELGLKVRRLEIRR
ncbi:receptor-like protein 7 [Apium graveolens]|uniref:receptor-like protein 7 n=1 Tax=Apium graveolens TaxID=4045 RepID=UPI003D795E93